MKNITKSTLTLAVLAACMVSSAFALEKLSDEKLAKATGQDGITITYQGSGELGIDKIRLIDKDGLLNTDGTAVSIASQDYNNAGGLELDLTGNIQFCSNDTSGGAACTLSTNPTTITVDTDGGGTSNDAFINVGIQMGSKSIHAPKTDISLVGYGSAGTGAHKEPKKIVPIMTLEDGVKIHSNSELQANLQLGNQPQGNMILLKSTATDKTSIDLGNITLHSYDDDLSGAVSGTPYKPTANSQITTNVSINDITSSGTAINIDGTDGIVMTKASTKIGNIKINNTVLGKAAATNNTTIFNGFDNAAIGNISMENIQINNLKIGVKGM